MRTIQLEAEDDFEGWRDAARALALARVPARASPGAPAMRRDLFGAGLRRRCRRRRAGFLGPKAFVTLARSAICHSDP
jgi:DNA polymerase